MTDHASRPLFHESGRIVGVEFATPGDPTHGTVVRVRLDRENTRIGMTDVHVTTEYPDALRAASDAQAATPDTRLTTLRGQWELAEYQATIRGDHRKAAVIRTCLLELAEAFNPTKKA